MPLRPPPRDYLDPKARTLWRISGLVSLAPFLAVAVAAAFGLRRLDLAWWVAVLPAVAVLLVGGVVALALPGATWRRWRYEVGEEEVDLQHGLLTITRTLIPMTRIQHVDTRRGPLQRRFGLASVILYTAAGASEIPALADHVAAATRDRVAALANANDDL